MKIKNVLQTLQYAADFMHIQILLPNLRNAEKYICRIKGGTVCNPAPLPRKSKNKKESMLEPENKSVLFFYHPYSFFP